MPVELSCCKDCANRVCTIRDTMIATYQRFSGSGVFVMDILECAYKLPKSILQPISKLQCDYEQQLAFLKEELEEQKLENKRLREQL